MSPGVSIPPGVVTCILDLIGLPHGFPHHRRAKCDRHLFISRSLVQIEILGEILFLWFSTTLVTAL